MTIIWQDWQLSAGNSIVGNVKISSPVASQILGNERPLYVYLPPSYDASTATYPVLYMHDGHNLFDKATSYSGEWQVDETLELLSAEGIEMIVVGIPNAGDARANEYTPYFNTQYGGGRGAKYLKFLIDDIKPLIDNTFRTQPDVATTGLMGSSLGDLISLYALFQYPEVFSFAGVLSPAFWFNAPEIFDFIEKANFVDSTIYMDVGTNEDSNNTKLSAAYINDYKKMIQILRDKGYDSQRLQLMVTEGAIHHEKEWAKRLPDALRFWWKTMNPLTN